MAHQPQAFGDGMAWPIGIGVITVLLLLYIAMVVSGRKDGLLPMFLWIFVGIVFIAIPGLLISGGYWLYAKGYLEDPWMVLWILVLAFGVCCSFVMLKDIAGWVKEDFSKGR